jgi:hypothetical protein
VNRKPSRQQWFAVVGATILFMASIYVALVALAFVLFYPAEAAGL